MNDGALKEHPWKHSPWWSLGIANRTISAVLNSMASIYVSRIITTVLRTAFLEVNTTFYNTTFCRSS